MTILEQNELALSNREDDFFTYYKTVKNVKIENIIAEQAVDGKNIICCICDNYIWRLNSVYEPQTAAQYYAQRYTGVQDYSVVCVFGISDGRAIKEMLSHYNGTQTVLIYEPDLNIFLTAIHNFDLKDIFQNKNVYLVVNGINEDKLNDTLQSIISYQNRNMVVPSILPNYDKLYLEKCNLYLEKIQYYIKSEDFNRVTEIQYAGRFADNLLYNLPYMIKQSSVNDLKDYLKEKDLNNIPAIIVSAGPSLDKNIRELKQAEGKAFIIAVDSALKPLLRENIRFNIAVTVDPRKNPDVFSDERTQYCPYVISANALPLVVEKNQSRLFFEASYGFQVYRQIIKEKTGKELGSLESGGSVATDAMSLAIMLGFSTIILIGQDLAFTDGRGHAAGFEKSEKENREHLLQRHLTEVEALGGGRILTDVQMASYREWFEMKIAEKKDEISVINATEGGARIHGAVEMTLKQAIKSYCNASIDFDEILKNIPCMFDSVQKKELFEELKLATVHMEDLTNRLSGGIEAYKELILLEERKEQRTMRYRQLIERVYEVNRIEEEDKYMELIRLYAKEAEYGAVEDIYTAEELSVKEIAERGQKLLEGYLIGIKICKEKMQTILMPRLKEMESEIFGG